MINLRNNAFFAAIITILSLSSCSNNQQENTDARYSVENLQNFQDRQFEFEHADIEQGYPNGIVTTMAASPKHDSIFIFQYRYENDTHNQSLAGTGVASSKKMHGLWLSKDNGASWERLSFRGTSIFSMLSDDAEDKLYISTRTDGVFVSEDFGSTWESFSDGLPCDNNGTFRVWIACLTIDHADGMIYGTGGNNGASIYSTSAKEVSWKIITDGLPEDFTAVDVCYSPTEKAVYAINGNTGYMSIVPRDLSESGLYRGIKTADGYKWSMETGLPTHETIDAAVARIDIEPGTGIPYASTVDGIYRKANGQWSRELAEPFINSLTFEITKNPSSDPPRAIAMSLDRLFLRDNGAWRIIENTPWHADARIASALFFEGTIYMGTSDGFWLSRDACQSWQRLNIEIDTK